MSYYWRLSGFMAALWSLTGCAGIVELHNSNASECSNERIEMLEGFCADRKADKHKDHWCTRQYNKVGPECRSWFGDPQWEIYKPLQ